MIIALGVGTVVVLYFVLEKKACQAYFGMNVAKRLKQ